MTQGAVEPMLMSALLLGLFGSVHCLGMCGGIAGALGQALPEHAPGADWLRGILYSSGRITSYTLAGAGAGLAGEAFAMGTGLGIVLRVCAGVLILAFGLHVAGWWNGLAALERIGLVAWRRLAPLARQIGRPDRIPKIFAVGMLWGWLPCGLVYSALMAASTTGTMALGAAFMACFGLGTLPALLAASGFGARLGAFLALRSSRRAAGILLLCFGFWSIAGALMPLHGQHGADPPPRGTTGQAGHGHHSMAP